jgi:SAM-dependent methyltransferase
MESFDRYAHGYDELLDDPLRQKFAGDGAFFIHQKCRSLMRHLKARMPGGRKLRMLDVGCGQGTAIAFLRDQARLIGTDVSLPMLREAAHCGPVAVQEPFALPFADGTFDVAYAICIYHHIEDDQQVRHLREVRRVLAPGGRACVFEHNPFNPVTKRIFERATVDRGCHMIKPARLRKIFKEAGFEDVEQGFMLFLPEKLWNWFGFIEPALGWLPLGGQYFVSGRKGS